MRTVATIAAREFHAMFRAPLAWAVLAVTQLVVAFQFLALIERFIQFQPTLKKSPLAPGVSEMIVSPILEFALYMLLLLAPAVTMRSLSEERRSGTLILLYSAPVNTTQLVLGKFLGAMSLFGALWILIGLMPLTLLWGSTLDPGTYACGLLGLMLIMAAFCSAGLFISSLTAQPAVAAVGTLGLLFGLLIIDWASGMGQDAGVLAYLSMLNHFHRLAVGICDSADIAYFLVFITGNLALAVWKLDGDRRPL
jgi:ABC-2 type transport system permease protein